MEISNIGLSDNTALLCHTNRPAVNPNSGGDWFAPDGNRVGNPGSTDVPGFERTSGPMLVRLRRKSGIPDEGIYQCDMNDTTETLQIVYVGLYNTGGGISITLSYTSINGHLKFFFYCSLYKFSQVQL